MIKCKGENCIIKHSCLRYIKKKKVTNDTILVSRKLDEQDNCKFYLNKDKEQHIRDMHFSPAKYKKKRDKK